MNGSCWVETKYKGFKKWLDEHWGQPGIALYAFLGCLIVISLMGLVGLFLQWPLLFPSLGPTVILFFERGQRPAAWPRNVVIAHLIAILMGWLCLTIFGLVSEPNVLTAGLTTAHISAAALSLALTAFIKHLFCAPHPPSGATTMIISLGFFNTPFQLGVMAVSILLVTVLGWALNRLLGGAMPIWGKRSRSS